MTAGTGARRKHSSGDGHHLQGCCLNWMTVREWLPDDHALMTRYEGTMDVPMHELGEQIPGNLGLVDIREYE